MNLYLWHLIDALVPSDLLKCVEALIMKHIHTQVHRLREKKPFGEVNILTIHFIRNTNTPTPLCDYPIM